MIELTDAEALLARLTHEMTGAVQPDTALVGIRTGGVWIAERLREAFHLATPLGVIDVSFYRDDYGAKGLHALPKGSSIPFDVVDREIILIDDVLYTGRTIRAALNELFDYGRPRAVRLAALVDRGGRELPIAPQFVGMAVELPADQTLTLERDASGRLSFLLEP